MQQRDEAGPIARDQREGAQDLEGDHGRQQRARHTGAGHIRLRPRVAPDLADSGDQENRGDKDPAGEIRSFLDVVMWTPCSRRLRGCFDDWYFASTLSI